jgi:hypothetical protein
VPLLRASLIIHTSCGGRWALLTPGWHGRGANSSAALNRVELRALLKQRGVRPRKAQTKAEMIGLLKQVRQAGSMGVSSQWMVSRHRQVSLLELLLMLGLEKPWGVHKGT